MIEDRKSRTAELFHEALALEPDQQLAFLKESCADDADLFRKLRDLLNSYAEVNTSEEIPAKPATQLLDSDTLIALAERYEDIRLIGHGGMGVVLRAHDRELDKVVALKILHPSLADDQRAIERFRNEIRLALEITHKNVCRTYGLERVNGKIFISMEYVEGETLRSVLDRIKGVSIPQGISWAQEICDGLAAAHEKRIVHRDLKPENIMIDLNGHAKVMDFGIARSIEGGRAAGTVIGTPQYMSPEQAMGKALAPTTDIYSLGLVLYEVFTGVRRDPEHPIAPAQANCCLPAQIDRAILKCLAENPEHRFQTARELAAGVRLVEGITNETQRLVVATRRYRFGFFAVLVALGLAVSLPFTLRKSGTIPVPTTSEIPSKSIVPILNRPYARGPSPTAPNTPTQISEDSKSNPSAIRTSGARIDNVNLDGAWSATFADAKSSAAAQFNLIQNSEGDVVGTYTTSLGGGGSIKAKVHGRLLAFELTQSLQNCPGIFKGTAGIADSKGTGKYTGTDCLGDHGAGTLTLSKESTALVEHQQIIKLGIGGYLRTKLLIWRQEDANSVLGSPARHRFGYDNAQSIISDMYTYPDPAFQMDHVELVFDSHTKRLTEAYLYPKKLSWDQCKQMWGEQFETAANVNGSQLYIYTGPRLRVLIDKDNNVISLGLY